MKAGFTLSKRIALASAIAASLTLVVGIAGWFALRGIGDEFEDLSGVDFPAALALADLENGVLNAGRGANGLLSEQLMADHDVRAALFKRTDDGLARMRKAAATYESLAVDDEAKNLWRDVRRTLDPYEESIRRLAADARAQAAAGGTYHVTPELAKGWAYQRTQALAFAKPFQAAMEAVRAMVPRQREEGLARLRSARIAIGIALALAAAALAVSTFLLSRAVRRIVDGLVAEASQLSRAVREGRLSARVESAGVSPEFRPVVGGMNEILDAFEKPIRATADCVDRISQGDIPEKIGDAYQGDFDAIKQSLNRCIDAVAGLIKDTHGLVEAAVAGDLDTRADATRHQGDFRKIVDGVNKTLDAVVAPIHEAATVLDDLAKRDLRARVRGDYRGKHAHIKASLNATAAALQQAMNDVARGAEQVASASTQIASSSQAVAQGASEQAAALEQTSSSLDSMAAMTRQSSDNAQQATALATTARAAATEGAAAVTQMNDAMAKIRTSAESTSQIIKDINEIAFQTNLLALNAAVEAARAGAAGRGFAVVAEEVRTLALRSKEAANKTEALIRESVKQAGEGETTSRHVSGKLGEIVGSVGKVTDIVAEIAASAKEQAAGIEQVTKAVAQMDQVVQQNAASSEETSSSAQQLSGQSRKLSELVGTFQLDDAAHRSAAQARPRAAGARAACGDPGPSRGTPLPPEAVIPFGENARPPELRR